MAFADHLLHCGHTFRDLEQRGKALFCRFGCNDQPRQSNAVAGILEARKGNKYGAVKTEVDGIVFDSKAEASAYGILKIEQMAGRCYLICLQPVFKFPDGTKYIGDFLVLWEDERGLQCIDVKGHTPASFVIKARLMKHHYPDVPLSLWNAMGPKPPKIRKPRRKK